MPKVTLGDWFCFSDKRTNFGIDPVRDSKYLFGDKKWADDPGIKWYREHFAKYLSGADIGDANYLFGTQQGQILEQVLKQCGDDLSRENIVKQSRSIRGLSLPTLIPGVTINTGPESSMAYTQLQLQRWNGTTWEQFGNVLSADEK